MSLQTSPSAPPAIVERFDPFSAEYLADPYPILRGLRETTGAFYSSALDHWVVTHYADVRHILTTREVFSAVNSLEPLAETVPARRLAIERGRLRRDASADQSRSARPCAPTPPGERGPSRPNGSRQFEPFVRDLARRFLR